MKTDGSIYLGVIFSFGFHIFKHGFIIKTILKRIEGKLKKIQKQWLICNRLKKNW